MQILRFLLRRSCTLLLWSSLPVIQVMRALVAFQALRELDFDAGRMHVAVAILTLRDHLMLVLMAGGAILDRVFRFVLLEHVVLPFVAGGAVFGFDASRVGHDLGHMRLVALSAIFCSHVLGVGLVALGALGDLAVDIVAIGAVLGRVLALILAQLLDLVRMAGKAGLGHGLVEGHLQRCMGVFVALQAVLLRIVRFSLMALAADGDVAF